MQINDKTIYNIKLNETVDKTIDNIKNADKAFSKIKLNEKCY